MEGKRNISTGLFVMSLFMAYGFLSEVYLNFSPLLVLIGAIAMVASVFILGLSFQKLKKI